mgnify:CR=1 FL=1
MDDNRPTIYAVDFDGTIVENEFPDIGPINQNVREFIIQKKREDNIIILWTTRDNEKLQEAVDFCDEHGIPIDLVNENVNWLDFDTSDKIFADVYVDDRAINPFENNLDGKVDLTVSDKDLYKSKTFNNILGGGE